MDDLISRQAAIARAVPLNLFGRKVMIVSVSELENLPSAQPEIIRCKDCQYWDTSWQNDYAPDYYYCPMIDGTRRSDFYCADAERKVTE